MISEQRKFRENEAWPSLLVSPPSFSSRLPVAGLTMHLNSMVRMVLGFLIVLVPGICWWFWIGSGLCVFGTDEDIAIAEASDRAS